MFRWLDGLGLLFFRRERLQSHRLDVSGSSRQELGGHRSPARAPLAALRLDQKPS